jgi:serine/threonine-protein kinase
MFNSFNRLAPTLLLAITAAALSQASCAGEDSETSASGNEPVSTSASEPTSGSGEEAVANAGAASRDASAQLFSAPEPWTKAVGDLPRSSSSDAIIGWLDSHGGWGTHDLRIEFGLKVLHAKGDVPFMNFTPTDEFYSPDCDNVPFPVPQGGALEEEDGYSCTTDGDCHLLVVHEPTHKLYEMWRADMSSGSFKGGCAAVWDLDRSYTNGRGDNCTSADAGGFPISAMVFTADEVAKGSIDHALRFILPNNRIRRGVYVAPATHASDSLHGGADAPPYGVRFRLRADFPMESLPNEGARVVARALQRYGMLLSDGGRVPITAADDRFTTHKWDEVGVGPESLAGIKVTDMEVVDMGEPIKATGDCTRN